MSDLFYLSDEQFEKIKRYFPYPNGVPRVDDRRVISGIIHVLKHGLKWSHAPGEYGPSKTLYNRFIRWSRKGVHIPRRHHHRSYRLLLAVIYESTRARMTAFMRMRLHAACEA